MNLSLFDDVPPRPGAPWVPRVVQNALRDGAALALSLSGGKDSHALLNVVSAWHREQGFPGSLVALHSDLGRAEWPQTAAFVEAMCARVGVPLVVVRRAKGDLVARFEERLKKLAGTGTPFWSSAENRYCTSHLKSGPLDQELRKPFWPSAENRYCTSDLKRGPLDGALRAHEVVISAEGVRADESHARAKKPVVEVRSSITSSSKDAARDLARMTPEAALAARGPGQRVALNWRPLFHWSEDDVWAACGTSKADLKRRQMLFRSGNEEAALDGWPAHPAYVFGNSRLSCAMCVLASENDLTNGANHNPALYGHYLALERKGGATFKHGWSLSQLPVTGEAARVRDEFLETTR